MKEKVLITGSNGLLGQKLVNLFCENDYKVFALSRGKNRNNKTQGYIYYDVDLIDFENLIKIINNVKPAIIINSAAMTNVDECEIKKQDCDLINVELVKHLTQYCKKRNTHLVHISTDFIFDGEKGPYKEDDKPNPLNYYGLSKLKSEKIIKDAKINYTILRTILVYGKVDNMKTDNIVLWIKNSINAKKELTIIDDQYRMPTFVDDLAQACLLSIQKNIKGIFNVSSNELMSIYDMTIIIANTFNLDTSYIKRITTSQLNQKAKRPKRTGFDLSKSHKILGLPIYAFKERLQIFKNQLDS